VSRHWILRCDPRPTPQRKASQLCLYTVAASGYECDALSFQTTRWSLVVAAGGDDHSAAQAALATLCETYWYPLYAYVRRRGQALTTRAI